MKSSCLYPTAFRLLLLAACSVALASHGLAQRSAPKKYTEEQKIELDHNNIKLDNLILPEVKLHEVSFAKAVELIRALAQKNDADAEPGINIAEKGSPMNQARLETVTITLDLQSTSLRKVLEALAKQAALELDVEPWAISLHEAR